MKGIIRLILAIASLLCGASCSVNQGEILEAKDVQFLKVETLKQTPGINLRITGLAFKSSMSVDRITEERHGSQLNILVHLKLARPGTSGSFAHEVRVQDWTDHVTFGKAEKIIWSRSPAPTG
jgi:hypothetical protein